MSNKWYWANGKQRCGPFTYDQIRQMAASSVLSPHDMVFNEGASRWVAADNVPGLFPAPVPCSSPGKYPEALPAQKPSSAPKPLDVILGMGVVLSIPFCCLGEFIVRPFLILAGLIWVIVGMRAVATGTISDSNGRLYCHPYYYRIVGAMVLLIGLFFFIGNLIDLCTSR